MAAVAALSLAACTYPTANAHNTTGHSKLNVITTTGILADFVRQIAQDRVTIRQLIPNGADPHTYEPSLRAVRDIAYADLALSNYMLLEEHATIRTLDANLPANVPSISVAEEAAKHGATLIPLVEDRSLDTVWLGMRVHGDGAQHGATRASTIDLYATSVEGPGHASSYITTSFGQPEVAFASLDGFDPQGGYATDTAILPAAAHQHMSWAFTEPGIYRIHFEARLRPTSAAQPVALSGATAVFAVGISGEEIAAQEGRTILSAGHADITANLDNSSVMLAVDAKNTTQGTQGAAAHAGSDFLDLDRVIIEVPTRTLTALPGASGFRFIGQPGSNVYLLPQAVLGKHVHGEIDPHLWHNVRNAAAYVKVITDALISVDPEGEAHYRSNAAAYLEELDNLDAEVAQIINTIPRSRRQLVTTSDAYGYLAAAYDLSVAGFVAPNPAVEPSVADRITLNATIANLNIPAVFLEPAAMRQRSVLKTIAEDLGVATCELRGESLDAQAPTYVDMMRANAHSLATCLNP
ncbi:anchored repeat ABC transporter, substrate-binding protein [Schaalia suimastitidis]|uniref:anchored repeat ABC transporter, substrate-binding protein n=1 Tax=Schaalia suimastitidis TaxID=121163 RepID=UPI00047B60C7